MALMLERRFAPFFWTQFLGAFTDNAFKQALILMITFRATMSEAETGMLIAIASGLFILPYFLFSPLAGQVADKFEKARHWVANASEYYESLRRREDLTVWLSDDVARIWALWCRISGRCRGVGRVGAKSKPAGFRQANHADRGVCSG